MNKKMTLALIGCGKFAHHFVKLFMLHPYVEKVYVCDLIREKAEKFRDEFGTEIIDTYEEVLASSEIDGILNFTERHIHGALKEYLNPLVIIAYGMFFCSMLITMYCYRFVDVSAGPILESAGYIFVAVLGAVFLKERFTAKKLIGMLVLLAGIALFSLGGYLPF